MPLEDLTGVKFIGDLNSSWPLGSDKPDAGDDHLRGIKNVLKRTFPNITGPITLTQAQINGQGIPAGARMLFFNAAAPTGWSRVTDVTDTRMLRIVPYAQAGGVDGGSDDPILNNKVASHTHTYSSTSGSANINHSHGVSGSTLNASTTHTHNFSATTGTESRDHTHWFSQTTDWENDHQHVYPMYTGSGTTITTSQNASQLSNGGGGITSPAGGHSHAVSGGTGGVSQTHQHALSGTTGTNNGGHQHAFDTTSDTAGGSHAHTVSGTTAANPSAGNWAPRYYDFILCEKDAL